MKLTPQAQEVLDKAFDALRRAHVRNVHFECRPRYCSGSPALVPQGTCAQEAVDEVEARNRDLTGVHGDERKLRAEKLGLKGICFARWEKGKKVYRYDLITEETFEEPKRLSYDEIERLRLLRNMKEQGSYGHFNSEHARELTSLEERAELHRQEIKS